jgi:uncharacterized protein GlcG (DUF336 family)
MSKNFWRGFFSSPILNAAMAVLSVLCMAPSSCGGGGSGGGGLPFVSYTVPDQTTQALTNAQVSSIINQAANEAVARNTSAVVAVVDRVGNVLGVAQIAVTGAPMATATVTATCLAQPCAIINSPDATSGGLEEVHVPTAAAAISKAITGAYLSSGGNAFTTRTANQIIQQNFPLPPVGENVPGGPLFGVQFSQLVCSDLTTISGTGGGVTNGPHRSPLGLAADPGGLPLYVSGVLVGGIGVMSTASYSIVPTTALNDNADEGIALAGQTGLTPPPPIEATDITVNGVSLNYVGASIVHNASSTFGGGGTITPTAVTGYYAVNVGPTPYYNGQTYGSTAGSGILPDAVADVGVGGPFYPGTNAYVLVNADGTPRYPPVAGAALPSGDGMQITAAEAQALVANALSVANQTRAGIRIPTNAAANITASVVDLDGNILAIGRNVDAPVFGIDVSLQKARSAVFFSRVDAKNAFTEINHIDVVHPGSASSPTTTFGYYMNANAVTVSNPPLFNSGTAFSLLAVGAFDRPYLPDGEDSPPQSNGPLSLPFLDPGIAGDWSPFSDGVQTDLIKPDLAAYLAGGLANFPAGYAGCGTDAGLPANASTEPASVGTSINPTGPGAAAVSVTQLANGLQIFSGGFPVYRSNGELVGAIGISGDGILQDALVAFIGVQGDGSIGVTPVGTSIGGAETLFNAPAAIRPDAGLDLDTGTPGRSAVVPNTNPLGGPFTPRFIQCPPAPWITSREQTPCGS